MNKTLLKKTLLVWLPFAAVITFVTLLGYTLVQQDLRANANDPQIQIAEDIVQAINSGAATPQEIVPPGQTIDITKSLDPFAVLEDASGNILAGSAILNGEIPAVPPGIFAAVKQNGEARVTWQPEVGVRSAIVVDAFSASGSSSAGYVIVGRSLREVEIREDNMLHIAEIAWILGLIVMFGLIYGLLCIMKKKGHGEHVSEPTTTP